MLWYNFRMKSGAFPDNGFSLVELLVAMTILAFVFCGWLNLANIQPVSKESRRYAAVEEAAGLLDAASALASPAEGLYADNGTNGLERVAAVTDGRIFAFRSPEEMAPGYRLTVERRQAGGNSPAGRWAVVRLYDAPLGDATTDKPFSEFSLFIGN